MTGSLRVGGDHWGSSQSGVAGTATGHKRPLVLAYQQQQLVAPQKIQMKFFWFDGKMGNLHKIWENK